MDGVILLERLKKCFGNTKMVHQTYVAAFNIPRLSAQVKECVQFFSDMKVKLSLFLESTLNFSSLVFRTCFIDQTVIK